ncbi:MAG TPA: hypothetical protein VM686_18735, partial [Polyangiaceae bacterium]|nr:hypothetical protein [Polyangiaceae bacterium]
CAERIWRAGIERVVIGCQDPSPYARGSTEYLRARGVHVSTGPWRARAEALVADRRLSFELRRASAS